MPPDFSGFSRDELEGMPPDFSGFSRDELVRYARHFVLPQVGPGGQARIKGARVLVVGAGGLGSPVALYLAAAGVGTLGIVDHDAVDLSNLQRQLLHGTSSLGRGKVASARGRLRDANPHVHVVGHPVRLTSANALEILEGYDLAVDGSDNFPTRYLLNDACVLQGKPYVYGAVDRWEATSRCSRPREGPATGVCSGSPRRRGWFRAAPRSGSWACSPAWWGPSRPRRP
jgi:sulfur-carrier protein adenylyltransferase/sulfurtransferase